MKAHLLPRRRAVAEVRATGVPCPEAVVHACRQALRSASPRALPRTVAVTSTVRGEGRSTLAAGTTLVLREDTDRRTVLVELDLERPSLAATLGLARQPGVSEVLAGELPVWDAITWWDGVGVLVAGSVVDSSAQLGQFVRQRVLDDLVGAGLSVVADLPPLPPSGRGDRAAPSFDLTLLVVRAGVTPLPGVRAAARSLSAPPAVVLNETSSAVPRWLRSPVG